MMLAPVTLSNNRMPGFAEARFIVKSPRPTNNNITTGKTKRLFDFDVL